MRITKIMMLPALAVCGAVLAACAGGSHHPAGSPGNSRPPDASVATIVRCYRAHGDPGFPGPVYDPSDGRWHFAVSPATAPLSTQHACQQLLPSDNASPPVPQAQFRKLVQLAECLRQHGLSHWPDPDPQGAFPLPPAQLNQPKSPAWPAAAHACQRFFPSGGISVVAGS